MSRFFAIGYFLLFLTSASGEAVDQREIVVIPLKGEISKAQFFFVRRALKMAENHNAAAFIVDMETYGGDAFAAIDIMGALMKSEIPTYTLVDSKAISAGAMIAVATQKIYMTPTAVIGAAAPVSAGGEDLPVTMRDKTISAISAIARAAAQKNNYNADLVEAFINKEKEVKVGDTPINSKGAILTLSAQEATRIMNGRTLLAAGIADSTEDLVKKENLRGFLRVIEPTGFEMIAFWITKLAPLFLLGGIIGAYLELKFHGTLIPGIIAGICLLIFFAGQYMAGLAGWEVVIIFVIGAMLLLSELFVHPGTVLPGLAGVILIIGSVVWAMIDRYPGEPLVPSARMLLIPIVNLGSAGLAGGILIFLLGKFLPKTTFYNRMMLGATVAHGPSLSRASIDSPSMVNIGDFGVAKSTLRPSGKAIFGDTVLDVITQGEFVDPDTRIRVALIEGARIVVERC